MKIEEFRIKKKLRPLAISIWMMISYNGVEDIIWTDKTYLDSDYYIERILPKVIAHEKL